MDNTTPIDVSELEKTLLVKLGFSKVTDSTSESFGNRVIDFKLDNFIVRVLWDRGVWFTQLSESSHPKSWYNTSVLRDAVNGTSTGSIMDIKEECKFWTSDWTSVRSYFDRDVAAAHGQIKRLAREIFRRKHPDWF